MKSQLEHDWDSFKDNPYPQSVTDLVAELQKQRDTASVALDKVDLLNEQRDKALSDLSQREQQLRTALSERDEAQRLYENVRAEGGNTNRMADDYKKAYENEFATSKRLTDECTNLTAALKTAQKEIHKIQARCSGNLEGGVLAENIKHQGFAKSVLEHCNEALAVLDKLEVK